MPSCWQNFPLGKWISNFSVLKDLGAIFSQIVSKLPSLTSVLHSLGQSTLAQENKSCKLRIDILIIVAFHGCRLFSVCRKTQMIQSALVQVGD